jgi:hypothetical protein
VTTHMQAKVPDLVIPIGQTSSNVLPMDTDGFDAVGWTIVSPAALPETVQIQVSVDGVTYGVLNDGVGAIIAPVAGNARYYTEIRACKYWKLVATGAVAAQRTFNVMKDFIAG